MITETQKWYFSDISCQSRIYYALRGSSNNIAPNLVTEVAFESSDVNKYILVNPFTTSELKDSSFIYQTLNKNLCGWITSGRWLFKSNKIGLDFKLRLKRISGEDTVVKVIAKIFEVKATEDTAYTLNKLTSISEELVSESVSLNDDLEHVVAFSGWVTPEERNSFLVFFNIFIESAPVDRTIVAFCISSSTDPKENFGFNQSSLSSSDATAVYDRSGFSGGVASYLYPSSKNLKEGMNSLETEPPETCVGLSKVVQDKALPVGWYYGLVRNGGSSNFSSTEFVTYYGRRVVSGWITDKLMSVTPSKSINFSVMVMPYGKVPFKFKIVAKLYAAFVSKPVLGDLIPISEEIESSILFFPALSPVYTNPVTFSGKLNSEIDFESCYFFVIFNIKVNNVLLETGFTTARFTFDQQVDFYFNSSDCYFGSFVAVVTGFDKAYIDEEFSGRAFVSVPDSALAIEKASYLGLFGNDDAWAEEKLSLLSLFGQDYVLTRELISHRDFSSNDYGTLFDGPSAKIPFIPIPVWYKDESNLFHFEWGYIRENKVSGLTKEDGYYAVVVNPEVDEFGYREVSLETVSSMEDGLDYLNELFVLGVIKIESNRVVKLKGFGRLGWKNEGWLAGFFSRLFSYNLFWPDTVKFSEVSTYRSLFSKINPLRARRQDLNVPRKELNFFLFWGNK